MSDLGDIFDTELDDVAAAFDPRSARWEIVLLQNPQNDRLYVAVIPADDDGPEPANSAMGIIQRVENEFLTDPSTSAYNDMTGQIQSERQIRSWVATALSNDWVQVSGPTLILTAHSAWSDLLADAVRHVGKNQT